MNASTLQTHGAVSASEAPAVLRAVFDSGLAVDEQLWNEASLRRRLAKVMTCSGVQVSWRLASTDAWVSVEWRSGLAVSSWTCPDCEELVETWDSAPTPESVLNRMSGHWCRAGSVTGSGGGETTSTADAVAVADILADDVEDWEELPSRAVSSDYTDKASELEATEADEVAEVGSDFFDSLVLVDAMGAAL